MSRSEPVTMIPEPTPDEYDPYYETYIGKVGDEPVLSILANQQASVRELCSRLSDDRADFRYAPGKWSIREVVGHLIDVERVFSFRALWFARGQKEPLPDMDPDGFVTAGAFAGQRIADLAQEHEAARRSTILLFRSLDETQLLRRGSASGCEFTTRAIASIIAGHERHHLDVLAERYGLKALS